MLTHRHKIRHFASLVHNRTNGFQCRGGKFSRRPGVAAAKAAPGAPYFIVARYGA
jgi:hypothetical protein